MNQVLATFILAVIAVGLCLLGLSIGKLLTGRDISLKRCGKPECDKTKKRNCELCQKRRKPR